MIKIACNYSAELAELIKNKTVDINFIKAGLYGDYVNKLDVMRSMKPVLLHGMGYNERAGMKNIDEVDFNRINKYLRDYGSPHLGLHLAIANSDMPRELSGDEIFKLMCEQIQLFKKNLSVPLLLENVPDTLEDRTVYDHYPYSSADEISKTILDNDVYFLLDISHAKITAEYNGRELYKYLRGLPLDRVKEIHVNGSGRDEHGNPTDPHAAMTDADYDLLEWTLERTKPEIISLEYYGIKSENSEQITENLVIQLNKIERIISTKHGGRS